MDIKELASKKCKACEIGTSPMPEDQVEQMIASFQGWEVKDGGKIKKEYVFSDFQQAMLFVNKVAGIAEGEGHHPSIFISYNKVRVTLTTFSIGGLSENDFIVAAKIDKAY